MMRTPPDLLAIVTVTFNSAAVLPGFLRSLGRQRYSAFTVYVIDNASTDSSVELLESTRDPRILIIRNGFNAGFAGGSNQGIAQALADGHTHIMLLNNDTEFAEEFFEALMAAAVRGTHSLLAPKIYYYDDPTRIWFAGGRFNPWLGLNPTHVGEGELDGPRYGQEASTRFITGCCMLVHEQVFRTIGLLDDAYFAYLEDADFCLRALHAGFTTRYVPTARLYHKVSSLTGGELSPFSVRMGVRNRVYFLRRHFRMIPFLAFSALYFGYLAANLMVGKDTVSRFKLRMRAFYEGLAMKPERRSPSL